MGTPAKKPDVRINPLFLDDDEFRIAQPPAKPQADAERVDPRVMPDYATAGFEPLAPSRVSAAEEPPPAPDWPMFQGIFNFPFYLCTLGVWAVISVGLTITGWLAMFWFAYGAAFGMTGARLLGMPTLTAGTLTLGYAFSCCLIIIESTSHGYDSFDITADMDWKGWVVNLLRIAVLGLQAALVGAAVQFIDSSHSWLSAIAGAFAAFPFVLLGALAADNAWVPLEIWTVVRSFSKIWFEWILFYLETAAMAIVWTFLARAGLRSESPWLTPLYAAPLLAAMILIYARLLGRLAGCIAKTTEELSEEDDDDEH